MRLKQLFSVMIGLAVLALIGVSCNAIGRPPDAEDVATQFLQDLVNRSFKPGPLNPDQPPGGSLTLSTEDIEVDNKYLAFYSLEGNAIVQAVQSRMESYKGLEISRITLTEISRISPSPADQANKLGEVVVFAISWAQRSKGSNQAWQDADGGYIAMRWIDYDISGYSPAGWRVWELSPQ